MKSKAKAKKQTHKTQEEKIKTPQTPAIDFQKILDNHVKRIRTASLTPAILAKTEKLQDFLKNGAPATLDRTELVVMLQALGFPYSKAADGLPGAWALAPTVAKLCGYTMQAREKGSSYTFVK